MVALKVALKVALTVAQGYPSVFPFGTWPTGSRTERALPDHSKSDSLPVGCDIMQELQWFVFVRLPVDPAIESLSWREMDVVEVTETAFREGCPQMAIEIVACGTKG